MSFFRSDLKKVEIKIVCSNCKIKLWARNAQGLLQDKIKESLCGICRDQKRKESPPVLVQSTTTNPWDGYEDL